MDVFDLIRRHEGLRLKPYLDTVGKLTIGYGRNLHAKGINRAEAEIMLANDIAECIDSLSASMSFFDTLNNVRQAVLIDMCFNLGLNGLLKFKKMLAAIEQSNYFEAAAEMLDSTWANQVHDRAKELESLMKYGG